MGKKVDFIVADILSRIFRQQWPSGKLPTQREFAREYGVSRFTIQAVIENLTLIGALSSTQGSGTYVREGLRKNPLIYNTMTRTPYEQIDSRVLHLNRTSPSADEALLFQLPSGGEIWQFDRLRIIDGVSSQIERTVMPAAMFPTLSDAVLEKSVQGFVEGAGYRISHYMTSYRPVTVTRQDASILECGRGAPAMAIDSRGVLTDGRVFAHSEMIALNYEVSYISRFDREVHQARL